MGNNDVMYDWLKLQLGKGFLRELIMYFQTQFHHTCYAVHYLYNPDMLSPVYRTSFSVTMNHLHSFVMMPP